MNPPELTPPAPDPAASPRSSLIGRLANVIAAPGELFDGLKVTPAHFSNWLVPTLLLIAVGCTGVWLIFRQPAFRQQQQEAQFKVMERLVEKGRIPRDRAEALQQQQAEAGSPSTARYMIGPVASVVALSFLSPFWGALTIWLIGSKLFRGGFAYAKALEVAGLANTIAGLGSLVKTLLILALGNLFASTTPAMFVRDFDPFNTLHATLGLVDVFALWVCGVRASGMARLGGLPYGRCLAALLVVWALFNGLVLAVMIGFRWLMGL